MAQTHIYNLQEIEPTQFHEAIYQMVENCTGMQGDYDAIRWYIASTIVSSSGIEYLGVWFDSWGWSAIVFDREHVFDGEIVSHEAMHDLYKGQGPMDKYRMCVLDWENMVPVQRFDAEGNPETPDAAFPTTGDQHAGFREGRRSPSNP